MNRLYIFLFLIPIIIGGCKTKQLEDKKINQSINSLNMNIYSNQGEKVLSIKSPYSIYDKETNTFYLKETTINLFKNDEKKYIITSETSKVSNNNKLLELNGNVLIKTSIKHEDKLYSHNFTWNVDKAEFLLVGNVKFENNSITLSSNKAILNKNNNIIEFFNPVQYKVNDSSNKSEYEVNSENAFYNIKTKSVSFSSQGNSVRSKVYF